MGWYETRTELEFDPFRSLSARISSGDSDIAADCSWHFAKTSIFEFATNEVAVEVVVCGVNRQNPWHDFLP